MEPEKLKEIVSAATFEEESQRKLSCPDAFKLAAQHNVALLDIARVCNQGNIRLCQCQLGCFK